MASLNFPASPSTNDEHTANGKTWRWNNTAWIPLSPTFRNDSSFVFYDGTLNVGVGTTTPTTEFEVDGTIKATALQGPLTGNVTGTVSDISNHSTSDLSEGSNLYYTQGRFDTALSAKSTSNLSEGSNKYFTNERVDDRINALFVEGANITLTYDDSANTFTVAGSAAGITTQDEGSQVLSGSTVLNFVGSGVTASNGGSGVTTVTIAQGAINDLDDIGNVTVTSNTSGEILKWNGTAWVNNTLAQANISQTGHTHTASEITDFDTEVANNSAVTANTAKNTNVSTNLGYNTANTTGTVTSSDGNNATIPAATTSNAGLLTGGDKTKLNSIESNATADQSAGEIEAIVNHDNLQGFVVNEHIDWTINQGSSSINLGNLPATALTTVQVASSQAAQLALTTQEGDVVVRSDENKTYMHNGGTAGTMSDFTVLSTPTDSVTSVNGATGVVTLTHDGFADYVANEHIDWTTNQGSTNIHSSNYTNTVYTHPSDGADPGAALTGATVFSDITVNTAGHVTGSATRNLTPANIGASATGHTHTASEITNFDAEVANNSAVTLNTAKETNVNTDLSKTVSTTDVTINSSDGNNVAIGAATTSAAGVMTKSLYDNVIANNAKVTNVTTNLTYVSSSTSGTVTSSDGTNAVVLAATTSIGGLLTAVDKTKLDGIAAGSQANVGTNLGSTRTGTSFVITSSTGSNVSLQPADTSNWGLMTDELFDNVIANNAKNTNVSTNLGYNTGSTTGTVTSSDGTNATLPAATTSLAGLLTGADKLQLNGTAKVTISDTAPNSPSSRDLWFESDTGAFFIYYTDADSSQWIGIGGGGGGPSGGSSPFVDSGSFVYYNGSLNVGIGTATPSEALDVVGNIQASGDVTAYSDARLKENITTIGNAMTIVKGMRGVRYNKIDDATKKVGVIAQEVNTVLPEVIHVNPETGYMSVAYANIVGVLIEAMKEQDAYISSIHTTMESLLNRIEKLENK